MRRALLACLLAGTFAAPGGLTPASALAAVPALTNDVTLTAPATGYLRVRLSRTVDLRRADFREPAPAFSGAGPVGYALLPDDARSTGANIVLVRTPTESGQELVLSPTSGYDKRYATELRAGVYRLFFLTRGGGSVRIRFPGQPSGARRLVAGTRVAWTLGEYRAPADAAGNAPPSWEPTLDFSSRRPGHAFGALWYLSEASAYSRADSCFYDSGAAADRAVPMCARGKDSGAIEQIGVRTGKAERVWAGAVFTGPPGSQGFRVCYANAGRVRGAGALLFFLPAA